MIRTVITSSRLASGLHRTANASRIHQLALTQHRYQSTAESQTARSSSQYDDNFHKEVVQAFTHNPIEGYIRNSPYETVAVPNLPLDQYVWQHLPKWSNHIATVSWSSQWSPVKWKKWNRYFWIHECVESRASFWHWLRSAEHFGLKFTLSAIWRERTVEDEDDNLKI